MSVATYDCGMVATLGNSIHGRGIRPDLLPHIFEPFRQTENARRVGGIGLGLAIVRHIVELHRAALCAPESTGENWGSAARRPGQPERMLEPSRLVIRAQDLRRLFSSRCHDPARYPMSAASKNTLTASTFIHVIENSNRRALVSGSTHPPTTSLENIRKDRAQLSRTSSARQWSRSETNETQGVCDRTCAIDPAIATIDGVVAT